MIGASDGCGPSHHRRLNCLDLIMRSGSVPTISILHIHKGFSFVRDQVGGCIVTGSLFVLGVLFVVKPMHCLVLVKSSTSCGNDVSGRLVNTVQQFI